MTASNRRAPSRRDSREGMVAGAMVRHALTEKADLAPRIDSAPAIGLAWLVRIRWAFAAADLLLAVAADRLGLPVSVVPIAATAIVTVITNVLLTSLARRRPAARGVLASVLVLDSILLTIALWASGDAMNPFSVLYLVHVALAALLLDGRATWLVAGTTCLGFGTLFFGSQHMHHAGMAEHLRGMLVAYAVAAAFVGYFVYRVARALERREREMLALRDWAARTEKLASLSALAAGAAHELGTPLATIAVVAKELEHAAARASVDPAGLAADARLVREEAERCRAIIAKMASSAGEAQGGPPRRAPVTEVIARVRASIGEPRSTELHVAAPPEGAFVFAPDDVLVQVLVNLVSNAFDASTKRGVRLASDVTGDRVAFRVEDDGGGIPEAVLNRIGEPFFSTKEGRGMGLGVFLARSFAERVGGSLAVESTQGVGSAFVLEVPGGARA